MKAAYAVSLVVMVALACSSSGGDTLTDPDMPVGLQLSLVPKMDTLFIGAQPGAQSRVQLSVSATNQDGSLPVPSGRVFASQDPAVATVDSATGLVTAVAPGVADITVRVNGVRAHATIIVLRIVHTVTATATPSSVLVNDTSLVTATMLDWHGQPVSGEPVVFTSSNPAATVTADGHVTFSAPGSTTITAMSGGVSGTTTITAQARQFTGGAVGSISTGMDATCGLLPLGRTYCFGRAPLIGIARDTSCFNDKSEPPNPVPCTLVPLPIAGKLQLTTLSVGDYVACGLDAAGHAYCWGDDKDGEIGNGLSAPGTSVLPAAVIGETPGATTFTQIAAGGTHVCALTRTGAAYCWGNDFTFQLGGGDTLLLNSTTPIPVGSHETFKAITAGRGHTCALRASDGIAFCWGDNTAGQLGRGSTGPPSDTPTAIPGISFTQISAKGDFTCGLTTRATIYCWGANESGQVAQSPSVSISTPTLVAGSGYTMVTAGWSHACALSAGGTATCWGLNDYGQLGRGFTGGTSSTPAAVVGGQAFTAISAGRRTTCAVAADGAYCWGSNVLGALGNQLQALKTPMPIRTATPQ